MTEAEWLVGIDPAAMLYHTQNIYQQHLNGFSVTTRTPVVTDRQLRLFACACCRDVWNKLTDDVPCPQIARRRDGRLCGSNCPDCSGTDHVNLNRSRRAVEVAERFADGLATWEEVLDAHEDARQAYANSGNPSASMPMVACGTEPRFVAANIVALFVNTISPATQAALLRCIINPWWSPPTRPCEECDGEGFDPSFPKTDSRCGECKGTGLVPDRPACLVHPRVRTLAVCIYEGGDWEVGPLVLADAMEEAGCVVDEVEQTRLNGALDACFCDDCGDYPECDDCLKARRRLAELDGWVRLLAHLRGPGPHAKGCWVVDYVLNKG